jgi:hypothetical protein
VERRRYDVHIVVHNWVVEDAGGSREGFKADWRTGVLAIPKIQAKQPCTVIWNEQI